MPLSGRRAHAYNKEQGGANKINDIFRRILKGENDMRLIDYKDKVVHFIAIGGCSMSGLAILLKQMGFKYIQGFGQRRRQSAHSAQRNGNENFRGT